MTKNNSEGSGEKEESAGGSGIVHGTHETKDSENAKKAAEGSGEVHGNEWE